MSGRNEEPAKPATKIPSVRVAKPTGRPYQIRYRCPTKRREIRISTGSYCLQAAEELRAQIEAKLRLGLAVQEPSKSRLFGPGMPCDDAIEFYHSTEVLQMRKTTQTHIASRLDICTRILKPETLNDLADPSALQRLQAQLLAGAQSRDNRPRSNQTVLGVMKTLLAFLNWAYRQNWLATVPRRPRLKVPKRKIMKGRPLTEVEFQRMIAAVPEVVGAELARSWIVALLCMWHSGLRLREVLNLSWDIPGTIRPVWSEGQHPVLVIPAAMQKNDTDEAIPILPDFEALLLELRNANQSGWIINPLPLQAKHGKSHTYKRPDAAWVGRIISRIGKQAGVIVEQTDESRGSKAKYASAHDLRRSFGNRLRNAGVPPLLICRLMRHASWDTTRRHYAPGDIQTEAEQLVQILRHSE